MNGSTESLGKKVPEKKQTIIKSGATKYLGSQKFMRDVGITDMEKIESFKYLKTIVLRYFVQHTKRILKGVPAKGEIKGKGKEGLKDVYKPFLISNKIRQDFYLKKVNTLDLASWRKKTMSEIKTELVVFEKFCFKNELLDRKVEEKKQKLEKEAKIKKGKVKEKSWKTRVLESVEKMFDKIEAILKDPKKIGDLPEDIENFPKVPANFELIKAALLKGYYQMVMNGADFARNIYDVPKPKEFPPESDMIKTHHTSKGGYENLKKALKFTYKIFPTFFKDALKFIEEQTKKEGQQTKQPTEPPYPPKPPKVDKPFLEKAPDFVANPSFKLKKVDNSGKEPGKVEPAGTPPPFVKDPPLVQKPPEPGKGPGELKLPTGPTLVQMEKIKIPESLEGTIVKLVAALPSRGGGGMGWQANVFQTTRKALLAVKKGSIIKLKEKKSKKKTSKKDSIPKTILPNKPKIIKNNFYKFYSGNVGSDFTTEYLKTKFSYTSDIGGRPIKQKNGSFGQGFKSYFDQIVEENSPEGLHNIFKKILKETGVSSKKIVKKKKKIYELNSDQVSKIKKDVKGLSTQFGKKVQGLNNLIPTVSKAKPKGIEKKVTKLNKFIGIKNQDLEKKYNDDLKEHKKLCENKKIRHNHEKKLHKKKVDDYPGKLQAHEKYIEEKKLRTDYEKNLRDWEKKNEKHKKYLNDVVKWKTTKKQFTEYEINLKDWKKYRQYRIDTIKWKNRKRKHYTDLKKQNQENLKNWEKKVLIYNDKRKQYKIDLENWKKENEVFRIPTPVKVDVLKIDK
ncbi:hypothetical protein ACFLZV_01950 [Candidatus Margulisiibacteriota bacterium]